MPSPAVDPGGRGSASALDHAIDVALERYLADGSVPGLALAVTDRDRLVLSRAAGWRDLAAQRPVDDDTLFEIGSIGKAFAAVIVLQLADEGRLDVQDPVVRYLPWFRVPRTGDRITIHHLLSHTAGIVSGLDGTPEAAFQVWRLRSLPPGCAPGRRVRYSNLGYKALGLVVEAIERQPYPEVLRRRILKPVGMRASEPAITADVRPRLAVGYAPMRDDVQFRPGDPLAPATWVTTATADGSVVATAVDLAAFTRALMTDRFGVLERMVTPTRATGAEGRGYGLVSREIGGRTFIGHGGGMVGYRAAMRWDAVSGVGAVVLQNGPGNDPNPLARLLVRHVVAAREGRDPGDEEPEETGPSLASSLGPGVGPADQVSPTVPTPAQTVVVGTYRSHNPWAPVFRVEARADDLWLIFLDAPDGFDLEQPLTRMARGWYRVGRDRSGPERLRFDTVIEGLARRAWLSGWDYYRVPVT